jgi:hypothetical protein
MPSEGTLRSRGVHDWVVATYALLSSLESKFQGVQLTDDVCMTGS